jgi:hypothetical protein
MALMQSKAQVTPVKKKTGFVRLRRPPKKPRGLPPGSEQRWFSKKAVASRFGVTEQTIEAWVKEGRLAPGTYFSRQILRWPLEAIEAFERAASLSRPVGPARLPRERNETQAAA